MRRINVHDGDWTPEAGTEPGRRSQPENACYLSEAANRHILRVCGGLN